MTVAAAALMAGGLLGCRASDLGLRGAQPSNSIFQVFAPPTPAEAAAWAVDPYDADKRSRGLLLLANAPFGGEGVYLDMYRAALQDGDPGVRAIAVRALALHGGGEDGPRIVEQFGTKDAGLRLECARALQRLHHPDAIDPLIKATSEREESDSLVRAASATALGQYAEGKVLDALIAAIDDRDLGVNRAAQDSLRTLTGEDFEFDVRRWVAWREETTAPFARRGTYVYPVFRRDPTVVEWIFPWWSPPNEIAAAPAGMTDGGPIGAPAVTDPSTPAPSAN